MLLGPSAAPSKITAQKTGNAKLNISWEKIPQEKSNGEIIAYEILIEIYNEEQEMKTNAKPLTVNTTSSPHIIDNLSAHAPYQIMIRGYTSVGFGPWKTSIVRLNRRKLF
jgi:hypothetical protein